MINFWLICLILLLLACLFLVIPAFRFARLSRTASNEMVLSEEQRRQENVKIFKERVHELEQERAAGTLSEESFAQMFSELEAALLNDVSEADLSTEQETLSQSKKHISSPFLYSGFALVFVVVFSLWFYQTNGALEKVEQYQAQNFSASELEQAKEMARQGDMNALLKQLYNKLKQSPDNLEGWQLLARSAMNSQQFDYAIDAYQEIIRIDTAQGNNPAAIYGLLAQAKYYQTDGRINSEIDSILRKALDLDPDELNSLGLLAIDAFTGQRYQEAKDLWSRILNIYPEHPAKASIEAGIQRANAELGLTGGIMPEIAEVVPGDAGSGFVEVKVSIDPEILKQVNDQDTVFIIARNANPPVGKPNIPLAVSRHQVSEMPVAVRLDDAKAMSPMANLSSAERVTIIARISPSGSPMAKPGDYEAVSADISPKDQQQIELVIQTQLN